MEHGVLRTMRKVLRFRSLLSSAQAGRIENQVFGLSRAIQLPKFPGRDIEKLFRPNPIFFDFESVGDRAEHHELIYKELVYHFFTRELRDS